jgi:hypothetical protein
MVTGQLLRLSSAMSGGVLDGATVIVRKSPSEKQLLFARLGVRKIIFYIKGA